MSHRSETAVSRRAVIRALGGLGVAVAAGLPALLMPATALAQTGQPQPEEKVEATLKRLFGDRPMKDAGDTVKLDIPLIAENGSAVPVSVEVTVPSTPEKYVKEIYIIADKNRRPMSAKFSFTPEAGQAYVGTNLRLGGSTDVRAIVEMNDATLLMAKRAVKVTVGGCGG